MTETLDWSIMVDLAYDDLNKEAIHKHRLVLPNPEYEATPTRIHWKNIKAFLKVINRSPEHWYKWITKEVPDREISWISSSIKDGVVFQGKRQKLSDINDLSMKYINTYVTCSCNSNKTFLNKSEIKAWLFECSSCGSTKYLD